MNKIKNIKYINKEELSLLNDNEKFIGCKCGKKPEFRWIKNTLSINDGKDLFFGITPYKGRNNEELCCKCANFCYYCGQKEEGEERVIHEETQDNPTGDWAIKCCLQCWEKYWRQHNSDNKQQEHKPIEPDSKKNSKQEDKKEKIRNCSHCQKSLADVKTEYFCANCAAFYCSEECCAASRPQCKAKLSEGNSYIYTINSDSEKHTISGDSEKKHSEKPQKPKIMSSQEVNEMLAKSKPSNDRSDNSQLKTSQSENNTDKVAKNDKPSSNLLTNNGNQKISDGKKTEPNQAESKAVNHNTSTKVLDKDKVNFLVKLFKQQNIKQISLTPENNLLIEYNGENNTANNAVNHSNNQLTMITSQQITDNQELQTITNYLQANNKQSLNQQELNNLLNDNSTPTNTNSSENNSLGKGLVIGIGATLTIGLFLGILLRYKHNRKRKINIKKV